MILYLILPYFDTKIDFIKDSIVCGIDSGSIYALNNNINLDYALGDFDSINNDEFNKLLNSDTKIIKLKAEKDETDTEAAIKYFNNIDHIVICGGLKGKRIDHLLANLNLVKKYKNIYIIDNNSLITNIENFENIKDLDYYYVSFFLEENSILSLKGFKYDLDNYMFTKNDNLCISNEIIDNPTIDFNGEGIVILSKLDNNLL